MHNILIQRNTCGITCNTLHVHTEVTSQTQETASIVLRRLCAALASWAAMIAAAQPLPTRMGYLLSVHICIHIERELQTTYANRHTNRHTHSYEFVFVCVYLYDCGVSACFCVCVHIFFVSLVRMCVFVHIDIDDCFYYLKQ